MHKLSNKQLGTLAIILIVLMILISFFGFEAARGGSAHKSSLPQTAPSQAALQQIENDPSFQYLVSYTNAGFQPMSIVVKRGDTVRFTNNSNGQLWVAAVGTPANSVYPGSSSCGGSSADSCGPLSPGAFWQFTFTQVGTYQFQNELDSSQSGTITITSQ